ncbi:MAG: glycosyltransferase family 9 protein [Candidatus Omnitrophota bacterium]
MPKPIQPDNITNIAVFRTDRIGEVLLSTVCISALKNYFPKSRIIFITSDYAKDIVSGRSDIEEVFIFNTLAGQNSLLRFFKLISYLKRKRVDLAVILNPHKLLHMGCFLAGIKYRLGYDRKWAFCLTHKIEDKKGESVKHEAEYNLDLLEAVGVKAKYEPFFDIAVSAQDSDYIARALNQSGLDNARPIIAIHPGSSNPLKVWPKKHFSLLIKKLKAGLDCNIVLIGSMDDKGVISKIVSECKDAVYDLSGSFTIKQLFCFFKSCKAFIGNDAGPMHIAASAGIPVIALFGSASSPARWRPWGRGHIVLHKDRIEDISVDEVVEAVKSIEQRA